MGQQLAHKQKNNFLNGRSFCITTIATEKVDKSSGGQTVKMTSPLVLLFLAQIAVLSYGYVPPIGM